MGRRADQSGMTNLRSEVEGEEMSVRREEGPYDILMCILFYVHQLLE